MFISLIILAVTLLGFDVVAARFGADARDGDDWNNHEEFAHSARTSGMTR